MKILLAVDGSTCGEAAVTEVANRPWPEGSEIRIISVVQPPPKPVGVLLDIPPDYCAELEQAERAPAQVTVEAALRLGQIDQGSWPRCLSARPRRRLLTKPKAGAPI